MSIVVYFILSPESCGVNIALNTVVLLPLGSKSVISPPDTVILLAVKSCIDFEAVKIKLIELSFVVVPEIIGVF